MPQYIITYLGGNEPSNPEDGKQQFMKYNEWLSSLGESAVSPANPIKGTKTIESDGSVTDGSKSTMSGYTIIDVETIDKAIEIAKACPFLGIGGSLEVSEMVQMPRK